MNILERFGIKKNRLVEVDNIKFSLDDSMITDIIIDGPEKILRTSDRKGTASKYDLISIPRLYSALKQQWKHSQMAFMYPFPMMIVGISLKGDCVYEMLYGWELKDDANRIYVPKYKEINGLF
jgi:hypothetical protein